MKLLIQNPDSTKSSVFNKIKKLQDSPKQQKIWTVVHQALTISNNPTPIATMVEVFLEKQIDNFHFFSFITPRGVMMIAESQTGGIVACSFEDLENAMKGVPKEILQKQISDQVETANKAKMVTNQEFFRYYNL